MTVLPCIFILLYANLILRGDGIGGTSGTLRCHLLVSFQNDLINLEAIFFQSCLCMGPWVLRCPYMPEQKSMHRVWCKRTSAECCSGIIFNNTTSQLENGAVMVQEDSGTFSLKVLRLSQGEGVYWCGLLNLNSDIIKLAEMEIQHVGTIPPSPRMTNFTANTLAPTRTNLLNDVWWILRWILMAILLTITAAMHLCFRIKKKRQS